MYVVGSHSTTRAMPPSPRILLLKKLRNMFWMVSKVKLHKWLFRHFSETLTYVVCSHKVKHIKVLHIFNATKSSLYLLVWHCLELAFSCQLIQSPVTTPLGLIMLKTTSEELACPREDLSVARKEELRKLLLDQVQTVLGLLTGEQFVPRACSASWLLVRLTTKMEGVECCFPAAIA
jgi:hypothetical protein